MLLRRVFVIGLLACGCSRPATQSAAPAEPALPPAGDGEAEAVRAPPDEADAATVRIALVRHAEKQLEPKVDDPPLTEAGAARAQALVDALPADTVKAILSTQTLRTTQTADPVAKATGLAIQPMQPMDAEAIRTAAGALDAGTVLVVGHSNTVPPLIEALCGDATVDLSDGRYGDLFIIHMTDPPRLERATFGD